MNSWGVGGLCYRMNMLRPQIRKDARTGRRARRTLAVFGIGLSACVAGCDLSGTGLQGANAGDSESILDAFSSRTTPTNAIEAARNELDADRRRSGLARIAAEPWGGEPAYVDFYRLAIQDSDAAVRSVAARALALHGEAEDALRIAPLFDDEDRLVRWAAARALQRLHNPEVVGLLIQRTRLDIESGVLVREASARALGQYAEPRVVQALINALDDPDLAVNASAKSSLQILTGERLGYAPEDWTRWVAQADNPFAGRLEYIFPAFERDARWFEAVNPFYEVPNETGSRPVGMPPAGSGA